MECVSGFRPKCIEDVACPSGRLSKDWGGSPVGACITVVGTWMLTNSSYTLTYTPSLDRILPSPAHLHVKIKNTSAIPLRAAWVHGPYTLYAATYPATFDPNQKREESWQDGVPEFEPMLKAGGSWMSRLTVPENIRQTAGDANARAADGTRPSGTWIIEISSQVIFSTSAAVHFELLVGRDEKSIELGFSSLMGQGAPTPGQLEDHQQSKRSKDGHHSAAQPRGVFSHAVQLVVDDTVSLWNKPTLPEWRDEGKDRGGHSREKSHEEESVRSDGAGARSNEAQSRKRKRIHLVVLTHGLHSNLGADMLYLKESIDAAAKGARQAARERKRKEKGQYTAGKARDSTPNGGTDTWEDRPEASTAPLSGGQDDLEEGTGTNDSDDEEEVIVRGFAGNATKTEKGIQYLGKRLAKWVLSMTYPDQPFLPTKKSVKKKLSRVLTGEGDGEANSPQHSHSSIYKASKKPENLAYKITSISFISHSLGGLTQTYAIAYIHKHSPNFFDEIKPINFVAMAAPFLGLSNENPLYVKFALDFGLVGRTGQDLGLTWRPPTMVRSGWGAMIGGIGSEGQHKQKKPDPGSKPLLQILPTGHTHQVLKLFRNRTVYSNVVNDGIVPLRTSCLLFLDWSGLGRVEKARRENGLVGTMAGWGWAELTGANHSASKTLRAEQDGEAWSQTSASGDEGSMTSRRREEQAKVPQPAENAVKDDTTGEESRDSKAHHLLDEQGKRLQNDQSNTEQTEASFPRQPPNALAGILSFLRPPRSQHQSPKQQKMFKRSQTKNRELDDAPNPPSEVPAGLGHPPPTDRSLNVRGDSMLEDPENAYAPPKTTIFESAGDILNPPLPSKEWLNDPKTRPRTIFHDRVYHPEDIPPAPTRKAPGLSRSISSDSRNGPSRSSSTSGDQPDKSDTSNMKVEEKIARAYHYGLTWRKVLVRLEPDAHNNMVVRRMFANAYGWPVIKHLVDTHFADTYAAITADIHEPSEERAKPINEAVGDHGEEVRPRQHKPHPRTTSELHEAQDHVPALKRPGSSLSSSMHRAPISRQDSAQWDDALFEGTDDDEDIDTPVEARHRHHDGSGDSRKMPSSALPRGTPAAEIAEFLTREPPELDPGEEIAAPKSMTSVGLGKSVQERMSTPGRPRRRTLEQGDASMGADLTEEVSHIGIEDGGQ